MENRIREMRAKFGLTQDELSERLDVSRQTIISLEKGRYNPSIILAYKVAKIFNSTIEEMFIFEEDEGNGK